MVALPRFTDPVRIAVARDKAFAFTMKTAWRPSQGKPSLCLALHDAAFPDIHGRISGGTRLYAEAGKSSHARIRQVRWSRFLHSRVRRIYVSHGVHWRCSYGRFCRGGALTRQNLCLRLRLSQSEGGYDALPGREGMRGQSFTTGTAAPRQLLRRIHRPGKLGLRVWFRAALRRISTFHFIQILLLP